jgi:hypothetical protein
MFHRNMLSLSSGLKCERSELAQLFRQVTRKVAMRPKRRGQREAELSRPMGKKNGHVFH